MKKNRDYFNPPQAPSEPPATDPQPPRTEPAAPPPLYRFADGRLHLLLRALLLPAFMSALGRLGNCAFAAKDAYAIKKTWDKCVAEAKDFDHARFKAAQRLTAASGADKVQLTPDLMADLQREIEPLLDTEISLPLRAPLTLPDDTVITAAEIETLERCGFIAADK